LLAWGLYRLARRKKVTDFWLLALLGVWAPVFALGLFAWNVPPRYTEMSLIPMLICAFAAMQRFCDWLVMRMPQLQRTGWAAAFAGLATFLAMNPTEVMAVVRSHDTMFSDHKGAADFIRSQHITHEDIVLAEDVLQQTYYLGHVDYWLIGPQVARRFVKRTDSGVVDFYTGTPVIVTPAMLEELLQSNPDKRIFVIGSGEDWWRGRRLVREDLHEMLESQRFDVVFTGRDGRTRVMRAVSPANSASVTDPSSPSPDAPGTEVSSPAIESSLPRAKLE
jgi:hypothetical protein